jgi:hypothetical protein
MGLCRHLFQHDGRGGIARSMWGCRVARHRDPCLRCSRARFLGARPQSRVLGVLFRTKARDRFTRQFAQPGVTWTRTPDRCVTY